MANKQEILEVWTGLNLSRRLEGHFGNKIHIQELTCLKDTKKSSIWKFDAISANKTFSFILKILPSADIFQNRVELGMYEKSSKSLEEFMPRIYHIEYGVNEQETWILQEYVTTVKSVWKVTPRIFEEIIPTVSMYHALTHESRNQPETEKLTTWLPVYDSKEGIHKRSSLMNTTNQYLDKAMNDPKLYELIKPTYHILKKGLAQGPLCVPELKNAGKSLIHGDLHLRNICFNNEDGKHRKIIFIDWESAEYTSSWFDIGHLLGILMEFRLEWHKEEEDILERFVSLYASEMNKNGVTFETDPIKLYKMAYVQRILETWLQYQLRIALRASSDAPINILLPRFLDKVERWGGELGLF